MSARLLIAEEVAERLRTTVPALHCLRYRGAAPPAIRVGKRLLFPEDQLEAWLLARQEEGPALNRAPTTTAAAKQGGRRVQSTTAV